MRKRNQSMFDSLVQAYASGETIKSWAQRTHTNYATARSWTSLPGFKSGVDEIRALMMDRYIGKVSAAMESLADSMVDLAKNSQSESVRVSAIRGCVADLIQVIGLAEVKAAIAQTNARVDAIEKGATHED